MPLASTRPLLGDDWLVVIVSSWMSFVGSGNFGLLLVLVAGFSTKWVQAPARRAVRLGRGLAKDGMGRELVDVPGRGPCARRAELVVEGAIAHGRRPAARSEHLGETAEFCFISHLCRLALERNVEVLGGQRDRAVRILREVPGRARAVAG